MKRHSWGICALSGLLAWMALPSDSQATTLTDLSMEQMTMASDYIVRAEVVEVWTELDERGNIWTRAQLEVQESLKGDPSDALIISQIGGVHHNDYAVIEAAARFSPGEDAVFFLEELSEGKISPVGFFQGKFTVRIDPQTGGEMLVRFAPRQDLSYDHRFIPHPPAEKRVMLSDVEEEIHSYIERGWDGQLIPGASPDKLRSINKLQPGVK